MPPARDLTRLLPGLFVWQEYDSAVKAELFSSAIVTWAGLCIVDPIPLVDKRELMDVAPVSGVVVTNSNHLRAANDYATKFKAPVFAHAESCPDKKFPCLIEIDDGQRIANQLEVITIDGAPPGEIALYHSPNGGTLIVATRSLTLSRIVSLFFLGNTAGTKKKCGAHCENCWASKSSACFLRTARPSSPVCARACNNCWISILDSPNAPARSTS